MIHMNKPFCGLAIDMGSGLGNALQHARGKNATSKDLFLFKKIITKNLSPFASTVLVDAHYGRDLLPYIDKNCTPMLAYEADVYHITEDRITVLPDNLKISDYGDLGVQSLKFFLYYAPCDRPEINTKKQELVKDIGRQCRQYNIQFLFEPIVYDPHIADTNTPAFIDKKPHLVTQATATFSHPDFCIDILKLEVPVHFSRMQDWRINTHMYHQTKDIFMRVMEVANNIPIVYLSAGVSFEAFTSSLEFACHANINFKGFMCGRGIWSDAIRVFGTYGESACIDWVNTTGVKRLQILRDIL